MRQRMIYLSTLLIVVVMCIIGLSGCAWEKEYSLMVDVKGFHFQPDEGQSMEEMLASLVPVKEAKVDLLHDPDASPVYWQQQQFLDLALAVMSAETQFEPEVKNLFFGVSCNRIESGPQSLGVVFYRIGNYQGKESRIEAQVLVDAQAGYLEIQTTAHYPADKPIAQVKDLNSKINARSILAQSERMGGREIRESMQNECIVQGSLADDEWSIRYRPSSRQGQEQVLFFNAITGEPCRFQVCK